MPIFLAAVGIIFRGAAFALRGEAATIARGARAGRDVRAVLAAGAVLPRLRGRRGGVRGRCRPAGDPGDPISSWTGATALLTGVLAVATGAYVAAIFLAADAVRAGLADLVEAFRTRALGAAVVAGVLAIGGLAVVESDAPDLFDGLTSGGGPGGRDRLGPRRRGDAVARLVRGGSSRRATPPAAAVGAMLAGLALAQRPDFLPGQLTFEDAAAGDATMIATLIALAVALAVIVPSLACCSGSSSRGSSGSEFHPIGSGDRGGRR